MRTFPNAKVALELLLTGDRKFFIDHEIEVTHYLSERFDSSDPYLMDFCFHLSRFAVKEDELYTFSEVADMIIEEYLNADDRLEDVLNFLEEDLHKRICSPFWHLLARSSYKFSKDFKFSIERFFKKDPCFFSEVMEKTHDSYYLPTLETTLKAMAPYIKYMPRFEDSHEVFWEHDFWLRGGNSYIRLKVAEGEKIDEHPMDYLEKKFLNQLPDDLDDWLESCSSEESTAFKKRHMLYTNFSN